MKQYQHYKDMYLQFKGLLEKVRKQDIVGQAIASGITVEQLNLMEEFVKEMEDMGFGIITKRMVN